jgi:hypothetical protein
MSNVQPLTSAPPLFKPPTGRVGDWSEPIWLNGLDVDSLAAETHRHRLPIDLVAALLLEQHLLLADLRSAGLNHADAIQLLDAAGVAEHPLAGPGTLHTFYCRYLRQGGDASHASPHDRPLMIPLRLHEAARLTDASELRVGDVQRALDWERAAAADGRYMHEWGLLVALRAATS